MKKLLFLLCPVFPRFLQRPRVRRKDRAEGIRTSYQDPKLNELASQNQAVLGDIYHRYQLANIDVYPDGIGFTALSDDGRKFYYLLVDVRPRDITFGEAQTTPKERFNEVLGRHFEKNLSMVRETDVSMKGVEGLAFTVHWPVRDLSQCDSHGGFLEYAMIYLPRGDFVSLMKGEMTFSETLRDAEIITSLGMKQASAVKVVQTR